MKTLESFDTPIDCDFLIIGAGLSGLYSALYASEFGKVCILTKSSIDESNSYWAQGGIAAAIDTNDSVDSHFEDTISVGSGLNKEDSSKIWWMDFRTLFTPVFNKSFGSYHSEGYFPRSWGV